METDDRARLLAALRFAAQKHRDQRRKDLQASPYINHPIEVAETLAGIGGIEDVEILMAAVLHDTLEDTEATASELEEHFGARVRSIVEEVSDDKSLPKAERKRLQIVHATGLSAGARLVKLADKICNVRDVGRGAPKGWMPERVIAYLDWAEAVVNEIRGTHAGLEALFDEVLAEARRRQSE